jgi:hypothetical protein
LTDDEKRALRTMMPVEDTTLNKTFFGSKELVECMNHYTLLLANGEYDPVLREYVLKQREEQLKSQDEWKRNHYEAYWGQLLVNKET